MRKQSGLFCALAVLLLLVSTVVPVAGAAKTQNVKNSILEFLRAENPSPDFGSVGGDWAVLCLARGGAIAANDAYASAYLTRVTAQVRAIAPTMSGATGALHRSKSTENARLILALTAIGQDPRDVGGWNLLRPFEDVDWIGRQGLNGVIFALLALDAHDYETQNATIRSQCMEKLLSSQTADGGWTLAGANADADLTAMALQALARYRSKAAVSQAAQRGFDCLSAMQGADGDFTDQCETLAQVVTACAAWGRDPDTDAAFKKSGGSAWKALLSYALPGGGFCHRQGDGPDEMASEQAGYAIVAYDRFLNGEAALYDMRNVRLNTDADVSTTHGADQTPTTARPTNSQPTTAQPTTVQPTGAAPSATPEATAPGGSLTPTTQGSAAGQPQAAVPADAAVPAGAQTPSAPKTGDTPAAVIAALTLSAASAGLFLLVAVRKKKGARA
ncbi:MAG: LPXTG cell wall anchor domain-containing protein [Clostridia bacterium]|nr:LPXTG cell wall anchor domain-containing protein [Clostridia bacterium]